jgi:replicative superfamily II helicase
LIVEDIYGLSEVAKGRILAHLKQYPELWPTQQDAIQKGLLNTSRKHFVVAVPTSSGKTLCGELAILQELSDNPNAVCFYVAPTRALVEEKSQEIKRRLRQFNIQVATATGALQQDELEASLFEDASVIVCTPEKLDLLIRHGDTAVSRASLFIIDEAQMISDDGRGLGLEFVVVKLLIHKPDARILMLSAMLPNSEDFGDWLLYATVASSTWRPTRQRFGEINFIKRQRTGVSMEVQLYDSSDELEGLQIPIDSFSRQPSSGMEKVVWAVEAFRKKGPVLVFCMTKPRCEELVLKIVDSEKRRREHYPISSEFAPSAEVEVLRKKIKREVANDFLLNEALSFGIAYHHADLPPRIRIDLEHLIARNQVNVVVSTTTLAEGINLPISTVIYEDWLTHVDRRTGLKPQPLDLSKFRNIAGRAGRATMEAEGLILFLDPGRKPIHLSDGRTLSPREYFIRDSYPPILSRFLDIIRRYEIPSDEDLDLYWVEGDWGYDIGVRQSLRQFGIAVLHAMEVLHYLQDEEMIEFVINSSLLAKQSPEEKEVAKKWFGKWVSFYRRVDLENAELRPIAMQIGLPLRAVQRLYSRVISDSNLLELFKADNHEGAVLSQAQCHAVTTVVAGIRELEWSPAEAPHDALMVAWLQGATIENLAKLYVRFLSKQARQIEQTCNYITNQLSNSGAWGMYALSRVLELILGESCSPIVKRLPLLVYFGVNDTASALFSIMGVERIDAIRLGHAYLEQGNTELSLPMLKNWARSQDIDYITKILQGQNNREVDYETLRIINAE